MLRKIIMTATMAAVVSAFVVPAAQAEIPAVFTMEGKDLEETGTITATGQWGYEQTDGGLTCHAHTTIDLTETHGLAHVTAIALFNCHIFGATDFVCNLNSISIKAYPTLDATTQAGKNGRLISTGLKVHSLYTGMFCPIPGKTAEVTGGEPVWDADSDAGMTKLTMGGEVTTTLGNATAFGALQFSTGSGTYGIS